jgi:hypothetical protein
MQGDFVQEMQRYPHLVMPIFRELSSLIPEPPAKKRRQDDVGEGVENLVDE